MPKEPSIDRGAIADSLERARKHQREYDLELGRLWLLIGGRFDERLNLSSPNVTVDYLLDHKKEL